MEAEVGFRGTEPRIYMYVSSCLESLGFCFFFLLCLQGLLKHGLIIRLW